MPDLTDHFILNRYGGIAMLTPRSDRAVAWCLEHLGEPHVHGATYQIEQRCLSDILEAAARDLLTWN